MSIPGWVLCSFLFMEYSLIILQVDDDDDDDDDNDEDNDDEGAKNNHCVKLNFKI